MTERLKRCSSDMGDSVFESCCRNRFAEPLVNSSSGSVNEHLGYSFQDVILEASKLTARVPNSRQQMNVVCHLTRSGLTFMSFLP